MLRSLRYLSLLFLLPIFWMSWGGYHFEVLNDPEFLFERWLRPWGIFSATVNTSPYAFFFISQGGLNAKSFYSFIKEDNGFFIDSSSYFFPKLYFYQSTSVTPDKQRLLGLRLKYPPFGTSSLILNKTGWYPLEAQDSHLTLWCKGNCELEVKGSTVHLRFQVPSYILKKLKYSSFSLNKKIYAINAFNPYLDIKEDCTTPCKFSLKSDRLFVPKELGINDDNRTLGIQAFFF
jgi:hypothetical protein